MLLFKTRIIEKEVAILWICHKIEDILCYDKYGETHIHNCQIDFEIYYILLLIKVENKIEFRVSHTSERKVLGYVKPHLNLKFQSTLLLVISWGRLKSCILMELDMYLTMTWTKKWMDWTRVFSSSFAVFPL